MSGGTTQLLATLDTLTFGGQFGWQGGWVDADNTEWDLTNLDGWWGTPAPKTARTDRPTSPGAYRGASYRGVRSISLELTVTQRNQDFALMRAAEQQVAGICSDPAILYPLTVADDLGSYTAYVELDGAILPAHRGGAGAMAAGMGWSTIFSIPLAAPDPRKFTPWVNANAAQATPDVGGVVATTPGVISTSPGVVSGTAGTVGQAIVTGVGTAPNPVVFVLTGVATNVSIIDLLGGSVLGYIGDLGPTDTVYINADAQPAYDVPGAPGPLNGRGALLNGAQNARSALTMRGGWPVVMPGSPRAFGLAGALGAGASLTVYTRGAWY